MADHAVRARHDHVELAHHLHVQFSLSQLPFEMQIDLFAPVDNHIQESFLSSPAQRLQQERLFLQVLDAQVPRFRPDVNPVGLRIFLDLEGHDLALGYCTFRNSMNCAE